MTRAIRGLLISTLMVAALPVFAQSVLPGGEGANSLGGRWVNGDGMTLYNYELDVSGKSMCNDACAMTWLPMLAGANAQSSGDLTVVVRDDGSKMWALFGRPLYTFTSDTAKGDVNGHNVNGFIVVGY